MSESVLYYEFQFKCGTDPNYAGTWHYATVYRVTPDDRIFVDRTRHYFRWSAKLGAKRTARGDQAWLKARSKDETAVWRP